MYEATYRLPASEEAIKVAVKALFVTDHGRKLNVSEFRQRYILSMKS